jgi:hypothetical protein
VPLDLVNAFLDWLRLKETAPHTRLTEADAERLGEESKAAWWAANKDRFIPPDQGTGHLDSERQSGHEGERQRTPFPG